MQIANSALEKAKAIEEKERKKSAIEEEKIRKTLAENLAKKIALKQRREEMERTRSKEIEREERLRRRALRRTGTQFMRNKKKKS